MVLLNGYCYVVLPAQLMRHALCQLKAISNLTSNDDLYGRQMMREHVAALARAAMVGGYVLILP